MTNVEENAMAIGKINEQTIRKILTEESEARLTLQAAFTDCVAATIDSGEGRLWRARIIAEQETMPLKRILAAANVEKRILYLMLGLNDDSAD